MRKLFFIIALLPFLSCAKSNETSLPEMAYAKESKSVSKVIDHQKWHVLLQKHVSAKGNVNYPGFKKEAQALQVYLDELSANLPQK